MQNRKQKSLQSEVEVPLTDITSIDHAIDGSLVDLYIRKHRIRAAGMPARGEDSPTLEGCGKRGFRDIQRILLLPVQNGPLKIAELECDAFPAVQGMIGQCPGDCMRIPADRPGCLIPAVPKACIGGGITGPNPGKRRVVRAVNLALLPIKDGVKAASGIILRQGRHGGREDQGRMLPVCPGSGFFQYKTSDSLPLKVPLDGQGVAQLIVSDTDGNMKKLTDYCLNSHYHWKNDREILIVSSLRTEDDGFSLVLIDSETGEAIRLPDPNPNWDIHCLYSPDRRLIVGDSYPGGSRGATRI